MFLSYFRRYKRPDKSQSAVQDIRSGRTTNVTRAVSKNVSTACVLRPTSASARTTMVALIAV